jgi:pimeloyl-ACP methyl ester carboxylesterase
MATDIGQLINALQLDRPVLVGHSYGTRVALLAAATQPYLVSGVILVDGSRVWKGDQAEVESSLLEWRNVKHRFDRVADEFLMAHLPPSIQDRIIETLRVTRPEVLWAIARSSAPWDAFALPSTVSKLSVPLLAIQSTYHDDTTPRFSLRPGQKTPYLDILMQSKPDTAVVVLDGVGHFSMLEAPEAINAAIEAFTSEVTHSRT